MGNDDNETQFTLRCSRKMRSEAQQSADDLGQSLAEWLRRAIQEKLDREKNGGSDISDEELDARIEVVLKKMIEEKKEITQSNKIWED